MSEGIIFIAVAFSISSIVATLWVGILKDKKDESDSDI